MPRRYLMVKRAERTARTRTKIEMALIRLLARKPYGTISMTDIARGANVSVRTLQRRYGSKHDVLASSLQHPMHAMTEELARRPEPESAGEAIQQLISVMFSLYNRYRPEIWAAYSRGDEVPQLAAAVMTAMRAWNTATDDVLARFAEELVVPRDDAKRALVTLTSYQTWRGAMGPGGFGTPQAEEFLAGLLQWYLLGLHRRN
jgi:AcrR family transcriptional regulator